MTRISPRRTFRAGGSAGLLSYQCRAAFLGRRPAAPLYFAVNTDFVKSSGKLALGGLGLADLEACPNSGLGRVPSGKRFVANHDAHAPMDVSRQDDAFDWTDGTGSYWMTWSVFP